MAPFLLSTALLAVLSEDLILVSADDVPECLSLCFGAIDEDTATAIDFYFDEPADGERGPRKRLGDPATVDKFARAYWEGPR